MQPTLRVKQGPCPQGADDPLRKLAALPCQFTGKQREEGGAEDSLALRQETEAFPRQQPLLPPLMLPLTLDGTLISSISSSPSR